jgi:anti-sigma regulatory factor (Ser/Thr protein kinase)
MGKEAAASGRRVVGACVDLARQDGSGANFVHSGVAYGSVEELVGAVVPFVRQGLSGGDPVFVSLGTHLGAVQAALGADADAVEWGATWAPHPARRLRAIQDLATERGARLRLVAESAWADDPGAVTEWARFDSVLNIGLAGVTLNALCVFDSRLPPSVLDRMAATHPQLGAPPAVNTGFLPTEEFLSTHRVPPHQVPEQARVVGPRVSSAEARAQLRRAFGGLEELDDLLIAVTEVVANALKATSRGVTLALWWNGDEAVVQVDDEGPGLHDPLAGYRRPPVGAESGRGLWMARQLVDMVHITAGPDGGTSVQLRLRR